jgi:uncharacterized NAD(P)/FAD-binding protein YdhS
MEALQTKVVIVGGGFSGTVLALQLLRLSSDVSVTVIDQGDRPALGLAYATEYDCHLLNVCAADMSAFPEEPANFWKWAERNWPKTSWAINGHLPTNQLSPNQPIHERSFLPRSFYGSYLGSLLRDAKVEYGSRLEWIFDEAVKLQRAGVGWSVLCKSGTKLFAHAAVLATGNFPPGSLRMPLLAESRRYVQRVWSKTAFADLPHRDDVLLIGSGLTSVDMAIALHSRGFEGTIHILSRHGLLPHSHKRTTPWPRFWDERSPKTTRGLLRLVRQQAAAAIESGSDWHAVMDSLRPLVQQIWQSLSITERRRFLRHVRSYWEVHRHRIAPEVSRQFSAMIASGQVRIHAGRITGYSETADAAQITFRPRSSATLEMLQVARVLNCSGPETEFRKIKSSLLQDLFAQGLIRPDELALGLDVDRNGALLNAEGTPSRSLFALGPARKGSLWETTAVPDLRVQAAELARYLLNMTQIREMAKSRQALAW